MKSFSPRVLALVAMAALPGYVNGDVKLPDLQLSQSDVASTAGLTSPIGLAIAPPSLINYQQPEFLADAPKPTLNTLGFHLMRSSVQSEENEGAQFALARDNLKATDTYTADYYLENDLRETFKYKSPIKLSVFSEGHISSDATAAQNQWRFGVGARSFENSTEPPDPVALRKNPFIVTGVYWRANAELDADRDFRTQQLNVNGAVTVNMYGIGVGGEIPIPATPIPVGQRMPVAFRWRPWLGVEVGDTVKGTNKPGTADGFGRAYGQVDARMRFNMPEGIRGALDSIDLFAQDTLYVLSEVNDAATRNIFVGGAQLNVNDLVGVQATYTIGRQKPTFTKVESIQVGLSVKF